MAQQKTRRKRKRTRTGTRTMRGTFRSGGEQRELKRKMKGN